MELKNCPDVRLAELKDLMELMRLTRIACDEDGQHSYDPEKVLNILRLHFEKRGGIVAVIGDIGEELKGYLIMTISPVWYSQEHHLQELSLFVAPDHRRSNYAKQLMQFSKQTSSILNLDLTIGVLSNERTAAKVRLYQRQFPAAGAFFVYHPEA
jgi:GNAT superfamily N-acetyltransferase